MNDNCAPITATGTLCSLSPVIVTFQCKCGKDDHCWTVTAYDATATFTDEAGHYPPNAPLRDKQDELPQSYCFEHEVYDTCTARAEQDKPANPDIW